jgi:NTE family protein
MVLEKRNLALVLSGGSARGLAHIGVLEVLEENHIPIDAIVGTSMGALIGGLYSAGTLNKFKEKAIHLSDNKFLSLFLSQRIKSGNNKSESIAPFLREFTQNKRIEKLPISFTAVATDLKSGKEVFIDKGDLLKGILASTSIPGVFQPVKLGNKLLIDGGVVDPLPQKYGQLIGDKVISVNAMPDKFKYERESDAFDIISEAVGIMTHELIRLTSTQSKRTVFLQLKTNNIKPFDFFHADKLIKLGRKEAKKNLPKIIKLTKS